ncbi:hypothetical protein [Flavobacterium sp. LAR06]|uniref:hypothetical protein n=1 Tax=Flavobacterium sp. LAR06 TaxID=3064897 RepID=UPI0035C1DA4B
MAKTNQTRKNHRITVNFTLAESKKIDNQLKISTCRTKAEYLHELIRNRPITTLYRNQSLEDLIEVIGILNLEINTLKAKLLSTVETLYTNKNSVELEAYFQEMEMNITGLNTKMDEVKTQIEKIVEKWLQS